MTESNVELILKKLGKKLPKNCKEDLKTKLLLADDSKVDTILKQKYYNPKSTLLCAIFLGGIGVDRFLIGEVGKGICKILFGWMTCGIWAFVDIFRTHKLARKKNLNKVLIALN